jgi:hypothetical protein
VDVTSDNELLQEDMFSTESGFHMAVNGVYKDLSSTDLYGKNLTWGFASTLGYNYNMYYFYSNSAYYYYICQFDYERSEIVSIIEQIWKKAYNVIAGCNNILQETEAKDTSFFSLGAIEKQMIMGEMYGLRAMVHFDLLRLFCPAPITGSKGAMPYVTDFPTLQPEHKASDVVLTEIVRDMEKSRELLGEVDTVFCRSWNTSLNNRLNHSATLSTVTPSLFVSYRAHRMNYFAATALLARIYAYMGDMDKAYPLAAHAYSFTQSPTAWFTWTTAAQQGSSTSSNNSLYPKRPAELYFALSNSQNYNNWEAALGTNNSNFTMNELPTLFAGDLDDYRYVGFFARYDLPNTQTKNAHYITWERNPNTSETTAAQTAEYQGHMIPMCRFSEMYHIMIEYLIEKGQLTEAATLFTALRTARGAKASITGLNAQDLKEKLVNDIVRETLTEGQTFFLFKRLNRGIINGASIRSMEPEDWVLPIPDGETAYQFN